MRFFGRLRFFGRIPRCQCSEKLRKITGFGAWREAVRGRRNVRMGQQLRMRNDIVVGVAVLHEVVGINQ